MARGKDKGACLGLVELPATHDGGGPVVGEVEGVDKGGVAVVVDAHGAALVHADKQRPERVVQQRNRTAALKIHRCHMLPQPCIAAHRPAPAQKNFIHHCCGGQCPGVGRHYFVRDESCTRMHVGLPSRHAIPFGLCSRMQVRRLVLVQWAQTLKKTEHILRRICVAILSASLISLTKQGRERSHHAKCVGRRPELNRFIMPY